MAVIVKYVVVRDGKEDMIFTTKKEAEAYDKMLDIAERLQEFLQTAEVDIAEDKLDELAFFMARHREPIGKLLKGGNRETPASRDLSSEAEIEEEQRELEEPTAAEGDISEAPKRARTAKPKAVA